MNSQQSPYRAPVGQPQPTFVYQHNPPHFVRQKTNGLAVAGMVLGILWLYWVGSILAVIFGHIALSQTNRDSSQNGKGMAIAAIVLGWIGVGTLIFVLLAASASGS